MARAANPIATATLANATVVKSGDLDSDRTATIAKIADAAAHITAGFFVGGAACFDNAVSWGGLRSVFVGSPASWINDNLRISSDPHRGHAC